MKNLIFENFNFKMKKSLICFLFPLMIVTGCQNGGKIKLRAPHAIKGLVIGDSVLDNNIKDSGSLIAIIAHNNTTKAKLRGIVKNVFKKGTWLQLNGDTEKEILVNFGSRAISFPQSLIGKEVVLDGEARLETLSVDQQKNFAIENEISEAEISKINAFKEVQLLEAKGLVVLEKKSS
jgi:hypothetical protein